MLQRSSDLHDLYSAFKASTKTTNDGKTKYTEIPGRDHAIATQVDANNGSLNNTSFLSLPKHLNLKFKFNPLTSALSLIHI